MTILPRLASADWLYGNVKQRSALFVAVNSEIRLVDVDNRSAAAGLAELAVIAVLVAVALVAVEFGSADAVTVVTDGLSDAFDGDLCLEAVNQHPVAKEQSEPEAGPRKIVIEVMAAVDFSPKANTLSRLAVMPLLWLYAAMAP